MCWISYPNRKCIIRKCTRRKELISISTTVVCKSRQVISNRNLDIQYMEDNRGVTSHNDGYCCGSENWGDILEWDYPWWRHQMETFSALLALCAGNSPVTGEFPSQRPVTRNFDVFFDLRLNKRSSKQSWGWLFETPSRSLWRHCNGVRLISVTVLRIWMFKNSQIPIRKSNDCVYGKQRYQVRNST